MNIRLLAAAIWIVSVLGAHAQAPSPLNLPELNAQLELYEKQVVAKAATDQRPALDLFRQVRSAMAAGRAALALDALELLAGRNNGRGDGGSQTWLRLALAWQAQSASSPTDEPPGPAIAAAYGAYRRAETGPDRIEALSLLGNLLMRLARVKGSDDNTPPADSSEKKGEILNYELSRRLAFQVFTALSALVPGGKYAAQIDRTAPLPFRIERVTYPPPPRRIATGEDRCNGSALQRKAGTAPGTDDDRILPAEEAECVDNAAGQTCLVFSRALDTRVDEVKNAIVVERTLPRRRPERLVLTPSAIRATAVCYANLSFGASYKFTLLDGLHAADGGTLTGPRIALLEMPRVGPMLGFKRGAYVLPANGPQRIALKTTNVTRANLMLRRIGDLNLVREIVAKHIIGGIEQQDACFLLKEISEKIASGSLDLVSSANEDKEYVVPIGEILQKRRDWLRNYIQGGKGEFTSQDATSKLKLKLDLEGDQVAAAKASAVPAGVFVLFGETPDNAQDDDSAQPADCPRDLVSQWFVISNIGLTLQRSHSKIYVIARELDSGAPVADAQIEFLSRSGQRIESAQSDAHGMAIIPARLGRGAGGNALVAVMAYRNDDFAFLDMTSDAIDLADRGLDGTGRPSEYDAFIAPSRGIFRPGESIEAVVLVRGPDGAAVADLPPVDVALVRDDGSVLAKRQFNRANADFDRDGGFFATMDIPRSAAEGPLTVEASIFGNRIGSASVEVHYYKPLTVRITPDKDSMTATLDERGRLQLKGSARADYLYGMTRGAGAATDAPAANLRGELQARLEPAVSPIDGCFSGFTFGRQIDETKAQVFQGSLQPTDNTGRMLIDFPQDGVLPSNVPLRASLSLTLLDLNGRAAQGKFEVPVTHLGRRWIGVRAVPPPRPGAPTRFEFILLDDRNRPLQERMWLTVYREQSEFVWSRDSTSWEYKPVPPARVQLNRVSPTVVRPSSPMQGSCPAASSFEYAFEQAGRYLIELTDDRPVSDRTHAITELSVGSGWTTAPDGNIKPDALRVWVPDQASFSPGEPVKVDIETPHEAGKIVGEAVINGEVKLTFEADIERNANLKGGHASATIDIGRDWPAGSMHIYVTSFRQSREDSIEAGPGRAIGGVALRIGSEGRRPTLAIHPYEERLYTWQLREAAPLRVPIAAEGLSSNAWVALAIVDEGILSLTDFRTPDPYEHFFAPKRFDFDVFDNYGRILYGRYGGDRGPLEPLRGAGYQPDDIVIWHSGIRRLIDGRAEIEIDTRNLPKNFSPTFQGQLRLMAWAWDANSAAQAEAHVIVRDPVVVRLSKPRFMSPGDSALFPLRIMNPNNPTITALNIDLNLSGRFEFASERTGATASQPCGGGGPPTCRRYSVPARPGVASVAYIPIRANEVAGAPDGRIELSYGFGDRQITNSWTVPVRLPSPPAIEIVAQPPIAAGETREIRKADLDRLAAQKFDASSLRLVARISRNDLLASAGTAASAESEIRQLEQLTSLLQILVVSENATPDSGERAARINQLIAEISALRNAGSGFVNSADPSSDRKEPAAKRGLASNGAVAFVLDVLTRASAAGAEIDGTLVDATVAYLVSGMRSIAQSPDRTCSRSDLYTLTVLVRLNRIGPALFRSLADVCAQFVENDPTKRLLLASAYGAFGRTEEAQNEVTAARLSSLQKLAESPAEAARVGALLIESNLAPPALVLSKIGFAGADRTENVVTSSWMARAANAALTILDRQQPPFSADAVSVTPEGSVARVNREGMTLRAFDYGNFPPSGIRIANRGDQPLRLSYEIEGIPARVRDAYSAGLDIQLRRVGTEGAQAAQLKQFETAYYTVEIHQTDSYAGAQRLAVVQLLPAGVDGVETSYQASWRNFVGEAINKDAVSQEQYSEFQDDRWIVLPEPMNRREEHLLAFSVRPTFVGEFVLPPLLVRDLDNPQRIAWTRPTKITVSAAE